MNYQYGLRLRPVGIGTVPKGFNIVEQKTSEFRFGIISYESKLSDNEINSFELTDLSEEHFNFIADSICNRMGKYAHKYLDPVNKKHFEDFVKSSLNNGWASRIDYNRIGELIMTVEKLLKNK